MSKLFTPLLSLVLWSCSSPPEDRRPQALEAAPIEKLEWTGTDQPIAWRNWGPEVFREARQRDCPVLLYLAAPGCEGTFATDDDFARALLEERFVAVRLDPFRRPDIARRYDAGGWPALAVLEADGRAFALAVDVPYDNVQLFLWRILEDRDRRRDLVADKVRRAAERQADIEETAIDIERVYEAATTAFDTLHGGFGRKAKFAEATVLNFLLDYAVERRDDRAWHMVQQSLDALLQGPMRDRRDGGFFAYAHTPDWRTPAREKDALDQAALVLLLLRAARHGRPDYAEAAGELVSYIRTRLFDAVRGVFSGRQVGMENGRWWTDPAIYADRNALLIRALTAAARDLRDAEAGAMAARAMDFLLAHCVDERGAVYHYYLDGRGAVPGLLEDQVLVAAALLDLRGEARFAQSSLAVTRFAEDALFDSTARAFRDRPRAAEFENIAPQPIIPYRDGALPAGNILAAELYMDLNDLDRVATLLGGKRLRSGPGRAYSSYARALLRYTKMRRTSP